MAASRPSLFVSGKKKLTGIISQLYFNYVPNIKEIFASMFAESKCVHIKCGQTETQTDGPSATL